MRHCGVDVSVSPHLGSRDISLASTAGGQEGSFSATGGLTWEGFAGEYSSGPNGSYGSAVRPSFFAFLDMVSKDMGGGGGGGGGGSGGGTMGGLPVGEAALRIYVHTAGYLRVREECAATDTDLVARELRQKCAAEALCVALQAPMPTKRFSELVGLTRKMEAWRKDLHIAPLSLASVAVSGQGGKLNRLQHVACIDAMKDTLLEKVLSFPFSALPQKEGSKGRRPVGGGGGTALLPPSSTTPSIRPSPALPRTLPTSSTPDAPWLFARCARHSDLSPGGLGAEDLGLSILATLKSSKGDDTGLQGALLDTLGDGGFELLQEVFEARGALGSVTPAEFKRVARALGGVLGGGGGEGGAGSSSHMPVPSRSAPRTGAGVTVVLDSELREEKARVKDERRAERAAKSLGGKGLAALESVGFDRAYLEKEAKLGLKLADVGGGGGGGGGPSTLYGWGEDRVGSQKAAATAAAAAAAAALGGEGRISVDEAIAAVGASMAGYRKPSLPEGTSDETARNGTREVSVPPAPRPPPLDAHRLVSIATLEPFAQRAFAGITSLNRLQTELFEAAYRSNENLLVCAPTGAGKTNVAMLAVCRELSAHLSGDGLGVRGDEFKIVYVAPMKALAQEVVAKFSERLAGLGLKVRELTGDMQLTRREVDETQVIVTTPEKWDVITRKAGEGSLVSRVRLLIIDEVHLLADTRGAVIESIVARTLRLVETSQSVIRIVGLSATLPNYKDVAQFLRVNPSRGLFHFGEGYRPVPLRRTFIGVPGSANALRDGNVMNKAAWDKALVALKKGKQVMVFVHSRKDTVKTGRALLEMARADGSSGLLSPWDTREVENVGGLTATSAVQGEGRMALTTAAWLGLQRDVERSRNAELKELFNGGFGIHHAGMLRSDRVLSERLFAAGVTKVLCCTATLAWGVNLPAHTVIIKGTKVYDAEQGAFTDLSILDVMQIFGRAGRPQFDVSGEGIIVTELGRLDHYLSLLASSVPIESSFIKALDDHLNAEVVSGTVTSISEAVTWLKYTYLYVRMVRNPTAYGVGWEERAGDPMLNGKCLDLITAAAQDLQRAEMLGFHEESGALGATDKGRVASHYYLVRETMFRFNALLDPPSRIATDADVLNLLCQATEFEQIKVRDDELGELDALRAMVPVALKGDVANSVGKTNVLLQAAIAGYAPRNFTLISDTAYISQSAGRIARALFEISLKKGWCALAERMLTLSKAIDKRMWWTASPLRQFNAVFGLPGDVLKKLEGCGMGVEDFRDMQEIELGALVGHPKLGNKLMAHVCQVPRLEVEVAVQPITRGLLQLTVQVWAGFTWSERVHGASDPWHLWVEDAKSEQMYHSEYVLLTKKQALAGTPTVLTFIIPVWEPMPTQYWLRYTSDRWLGCAGLTEVSFRHLILPHRPPTHTDLLPLPPLPTTALHHPARQALYPFSHFNPVQTQFFHALYRTDRSVLLGAPTGSGKTLAAELALFRLFDAHPGKKAVYIAPLKALVAERVKDWGKRLGALGKRCVELTGETAPDAAALHTADVIITTPEKWDVVSRGWAKKQYVGAVGVVIIDEIHLLGEERGPVLEVIVSRMRHIVASGSGSSGGSGGSGGSSSPEIRIVGLSTALANASDVGDWLGIEGAGLYNFRPSVRPIPMECHVEGFSGKHYCPRMASMNKPTFRAITTYSPRAPALVFVSSRRQTRLTALELIALCAGEDNPRRFVHMGEEEVVAACERAVDDALQHTLAFGIGLHHAGLCEGDRDLVEALFCARKIQVLVCTSTLAWGVNFPAHLVVVKGTEYFDGKTMRYVDYPVTDILQMMGRAGRPGMDTEGVAVILAAQGKKTFYKKFLYEPFPVESHLHGDVLAEHLNAEVAGGTITSRHDAVEYLTWTYFFRRLLINPSFYGLEGTSSAQVRKYLYDTVDEALGELAQCGCLLLGEEALMALRRGGQQGEGEVEGEGEGEEGAGGGEGEGLPSNAAGSNGSGSGGGVVSLQAAMEKAQRDKAAGEVAAAASLEHSMSKLGGAMGKVAFNVLRSSAPSMDATLTASDDAQGTNAAMGGGGGGAAKGSSSSSTSASASTSASPALLPLAEDAIAPTVAGMITSSYYLKRNTVAHFTSRFPTCHTPMDLLALLCDAPDFAQTPVRHNEEELNEGLSLLLPPSCKYPGARNPPWGSPHVKSFLLLAARMARAPLPISDYTNDTKSVLDGAFRLLGAVVDAAGDAGCGAIITLCATISQCLVMAVLPEDHPLVQLPRVVRGGGGGVGGGAGGVTAKAEALRVALGGGGGGGGGDESSSWQGVDPVLTLLSRASDATVGRAVESVGLVGRGDGGVFTVALRSLPLPQVSVVVEGGGGGGGGGGG